MHAGRIVIVTPALADANNGNWQTARRWARMLASAYRVQLLPRWPEPGDPAAVSDGPPTKFQVDRPTEAQGDVQRDGHVSAQVGAQVDPQVDPHIDPEVHPHGDPRSALPSGAVPQADLMIALHARRSAPSIRVWREARPSAPLVVALTGTDLYRDIDHDADAQRSLAMADALIVLNALGAQRLPPALRAKCHVVLQSCGARRTLDKPLGPRNRLRALMVGHLREEKDPRTLFEAVRLLAPRMGPDGDLRVDHVGHALDPALGAAAQALAAEVPGYRWLGGQSHEQTRRRIQAAHVLVHPSRMEGGAHVVIEAVRSGTPVVASRIDGNVGLLGDDYPGYFPPGDAAALARCLERARDDPAWRADLQQAAALRAPLFAPEAERQALLGVLRRHGLP
jgi:putative glycosyltransferase (TIGR04348 family)